MTLKNLELTDELRARIRDVEAALAVHRSGLDSAAKVEIPKLALAEELLQAVRSQRLSDVKKPKPAAATMRAHSKRRRA